MNWSDSDNEVVEITSNHGTQAEQDKQVNFVKEETSYWKRNENIYDHMIEHVIKNVPIVYTTRLEQMNAFKKTINQLTHKNITEMILNESKPRLSQNIKHGPIYESHAAYIELCSQVEELNIKARKKAEQMYKLKKMCKPVKVVLEDINKMCRTVSSKKAALDSGLFSLDSSILKKISKCLTEKKESLESGEHTFDNEMGATKSSPYTLHANEPSDDSEILTLTAIVIKHKKSYLADIYIVDAIKGIESFYRTNISECNKLKQLIKLHSCNRIMFLEYCCWVNREKCIKKIIQTKKGFYAGSISNFLRKPHDCLPGHCKCCCLQEPLLPKISSKLNVEFIKQPNNKNLNSVRTPVDNLIQKSMNYTPKEPDTFPNPNIEPGNYMKSAFVIIKYQDVIFRQIKTLGENYEIGNMGDIEIYEKPTINRNIFEELELYRQIYNMIEKSMTYYAHLVCCWRKREDVLNGMNTHLKPSTLRFMKIPHPCRSDRCECCCSEASITAMENITNSSNKLVYHKKRTMIKIPLNNQALDKEVANDTVNSKCLSKMSPKQTYFVLGASQKNTNLSAHAFKIVTEIDLTQDSTIQAKYKRSPKVTRQPNMFKRRTNSAKKQIKTSQRETLKPTSKPTQHPTLNSTPKPTSKPTQHPTLNSTPKPTPPARGELINEVLDKFKDLKLTVNDKGKLTAIIKATVDMLSPVEMKGLSDILSHAALHIKKLGIDPREFCNRVNSERAANGYVSMTISQLVGISTVVNQTAMNSSALQNEIHTPVTQRKPQTLAPPVATHRHEKESQPMGSMLSSHSTSDIYQLMSTCDGQKHRAIVNSFNTHFGIKGKSIQARSDTSVPKIANVFTLAGVESKSTDIAAAAAAFKPVATNMSTVESQETKPAMSHNQGGNLYPVIPVPVAGTNQPIKFPRPIIIDEINPVISNKSDKKVVFIPGIWVVANTTTGPAHVQSPILYQMLPQRPSGPPETPALAPLSPRSNPRKISVAPTILAQPPNKAKRKRGNADNKGPPSKKSNHPAPADKVVNDKKSNNDIETSLRTHVIEKPVRNDQKESRDEIFHVID